MKSLLKKSLCHNIFSFAWLRSLRKNIIDVSSFRELQCVAGKYISPAATSVPALDPVPALPVELVPLRGFFLLLSVLFSRGRAVSGETALCACAYRRARSSSLSVALSGLMR